MSTSLRLPDIGVDFGFTQQMNSSVIVTEFGDGYNQRAVDGINETRYMYNVSWSNIDTERMRTLRDFFLGTKCVTAFKWTPPDIEQDLTFVLERNTLQIIPIAHGIWTISATLSQVFDN